MDVPLNLGVDQLSLRQNAQNGKPTDEVEAPPISTAISPPLWCNPAGNTDVRQSPKLLARSQKIVPARDFHGENRGRMDIDNYLMNNASILLDVDTTDLEEILYRMVEEKPGHFFDATKSKRNPQQQQQQQQPYIPFTKIREKVFNLGLTNGGNDGENKFKYFGTNALREYLQAIMADALDHHQNASSAGGNGILEDQSWFALYCSLEEIASPRIAFSRLQGPTNFGSGLGEVNFIFLVLAPLKQKETKSALEIARTFGTLLANAQTRNALRNANNEREFVDVLREQAKHLTEQRGTSNKQHPSLDSSTTSTSSFSQPQKWFPGRGLVQDLRRRLPHYKNDYLDGIVDSRALQKTISSAIFLFFIVLPTAIALGMLNEENTHDRINVKKVILGQWIGGILFGIFGGQLFLIVLTSPPISIYIKVIDRISQSTGLDFFQLYSGIGLWCCFYLFLFALFEASNVMKYAKRSLEELFGMFIACTLTIEAIKAAFRMLHRAFLPHCLEEADVFTSHPHPPPPPPPFGIPLPSIPPHLDPLNCDRSVGLLFLLLMLATAWLALTLSNFRQTPFLGKRKREIVSDYALPLAVCAMTLVANNWFGDVPKDTFNLTEHTPSFTLGRFWLLPFKGHLICCALGFPLTILFAMDQMIVTNTVDNNQNNLKKGPAANWDFFVVSLINIPLSLFGLPWMHAALPQSYLHLKAQADVEDQLVNGIVQPVIVKNRESRLATLLAHLLMVPTYFFALPLLRHFPTSIFHGVFLFLAYSSTIGNELCQRVLLLFTEQRSYPPTHYIRRVPQRIVHLFTATELLQLGLLLLIGHFPWPVIRLLFPVALIVYIPLRSLLLPLIFRKDHLEVLDGVH